MLSLVVVNVPATGPRVVTKSRKKLASKSILIRVGYVSSNYCGITRWSAHTQHGTLGHTERALSRTPPYNSDASRARLREQW